MDETSPEPVAGPPERVGRSHEAYRPRGYQLEMLEASLQQNIIVAVRVTLLKDWSILTRV